jgi:hypothetical protein
MAKGPFSPSEFVDTEFSTAADKADFGNTFLHFLDADCERNLFTKKFYNRLSMTFGNIAHYDIHGFYGTWFTADRHKAAFVQRTLRWPCYGDAKFTFSDVEHAIQRVVRQRNYLAHYELRASEALRSAEVRELERLEAKYRTSAAAPREDVVQEHTRPAPEDSEQPSAAIPIQASLF